MAETKAFTLPASNSQSAASWAQSLQSAVSNGRLTPARHGSPVSVTPIADLQSISSDNGENNGFQEREEIAMKGIGSAGGWPL
jgi:hypothetical protein